MTFSIKNCKFSLVFTFLVSWTFAFAVPRNACLASGTKEIRLFIVFLGCIVVASFASYASVRSAAHRVHNAHVIILTLVLRRVFYNILTGLRRENLRPLHGCIHTCSERRHLRQHSSRSRD